MNTQTHGQADNGPITQELREVVARAEDLMRSISQAEEAAVVQLRQRAAATVNDAKAKLSEVGIKARGNTKDFLRTAEGYVRENPWTSVASAAATGLIVGALMVRR